MTTPDPWWTDEDVEAASRAWWQGYMKRPDAPPWEDVLAALSPRVAALVADAERSAAVKALGEFSRAVNLCWDDHGYLKDYVWSLQAPHHPTPVVDAEDGGR